MKTDHPAESLAIQTSGLSRTFGKVVAVDEVSLKVPRGVVYGLIGLNGAGKSTLLRMTMGLVRASAGIAIVDGVNIATDPLAARRRVGYVPDRITAYPWMRVREVLSFTRALRSEWNQALVDEHLSRGRIDLSSKISKLSKGTAAKLSLTLALAHDPEILVLDEPTDGLDPIARDDFMELVIASSTRGTEQDNAGIAPRTILLSSHSMDDVQRMTDWIGLMHGGRLVRQCRTDELVNSTKRIRAVLEGEQTTADGRQSLAPAAPAGAVFSRVVGREWIVTLPGMDASGPQRATAIAEIESRGARVIEVQDLSLDDIFKDVVRGAQASGTTRTQEAAA